MDTALTFARFDLIFELLAAGAALESPELYKHVLLTAARKDRVDILDLFKDAGLDVNRPNHELDRVKHVYPRPSRGRILLHYASECRAERVAQWLLDNRADVNAVDQGGVTPLHLAQDDTTCQMLISHGANINAQTKDGLTPLHMATTGSIVMILLNSGAQLDVQAKDGTTPLIKHVRESPAIARLLIEHGVNVTAQNEKGFTALYTATQAFSTDTETFCYFQRRSRPLRPWFTALDADKVFEESELVRALLEGGADANAKDAHGNTPLHRILRRWKGRSLPFVKCLVAAGADVNALNKESCSPLALLLWPELRWLTSDISHFQSSIIELIKSGAELTSVDKKFLKGTWVVGNHDARRRRQEMEDAWLSWYRQQLWQPSELFREEMSSHFNGHDHGTVIRIACLSASDCSEAFDSERCWTQMIKWAYLTNLIACGWHSP
eukprot:TRINITY_DN12439_c0_g1_i12.p2 TRINITY_DN12439_c0_g1~~TRINITY_DN12439_c0_g1_i12.p2  ORF type:complete len:439 (+),score=54.83 TRINITY_DN12439_c0_g1_i12:718-2034(+)